MRIALVTTPPSLSSEIGDYTRRLLPHLSKLAEVEVFVQAGLEGEELEGRITRSAGDLRPLEVDQVLYQLGNEPGHAFMAPLVRALGGTVVLHDWVLFDLAAAAWPELERGAWRGLRTVLREGGVRQARVWLENHRGRRLPGSVQTLARDRFELPLNRSVVRFADGFLVHSECVGRRVLEDRNARTPIGIVPHGADPCWRPGERREERAALGLEGGWRDGFLITSCGALLPHKRLDVVLEALVIARKSRADMHLALIGREHPGEFDARARARALGLESAVRFTGHLPEEETSRWLHAGDLAVQLRGPSTGATSGRLHQALAVGRGVIASALDEQKELPDECVHKLHPGEDEPARLAQKLVELHDSPSVRRAMEQSARDYVRGTCAWQEAARRYVEFLEHFPRARAGRKTLWAMRLESSAREGYARGRSGSRDA